MSTPTNPPTGECSPAESRGGETLVPEARRPAESNTRVTDAGLAHLEGLTRLEWLTLDLTQVTGAGMEHLQGLTKLETLLLSNTQVTDAGLKYLDGLTALKWLELTNDVRPALETTSLTDVSLARSHR